MATRGTYGAGSACRSRCCTDLGHPLEAAARACAMRSAITIGHQLVTGAKLTRKRPDDQPGSPSVEEWRPKPAHVRASGVEPQAVTPTTTRWQMALNRGEAGESWGLSVMEFRTETFRNRILDSRPAISISSEKMQCQSWNLS